MDSVNEERFDEALEKVRPMAKADDNINGIAIGRRLVGGVLTNELAVKVYVTRKRPAAYVSAKKLLPKTVRTSDGEVRVDVEEAGPFYALTLLSRADQVRSTSEFDAVAFQENIFVGRVRPVPYGVSLGHRDITAGTFGCLVTSVPDGSTQILSNNHVLAMLGQASIGDPILQPGSFDGGVDPNDRIATLTRFVPLNPTGPNTVDAALAAPVSPSIVTTASAVAAIGPVGDPSRAVGILFAGDCSGNIFACKAANVASALSITFPGGHATATTGDLVHKVGRTTGWTVSHVVDDNVEILVNMGSGTSMRFTDLLRIPEMGHGGDSGSIILEAPQG